MTDPKLPAEQIQLEQATLLAEVEVYLEFGYKDQAAQALRDYLEQTPDAAPEQHQALLELYLELDELNAFSETMFDEYRYGLLPVETLNGLLQRALQLDADHMILHDLAEQYCPEAIPQGLRRPMLPSPDTMAAKPTALPTVRTSLHGSPFGKQQLVNGKRLLLPLSAAECSAISTLVPPSSRTRLLYAGGRAEAAIRSLMNEFKTSKRPLTPLVNLLRLHFLNNDIDAYARYLWRLNLILAPHGEILRNRLLSFAQRLGHHPVFNALREAKSNAEVRHIGLEHGFLSEPITGRQALVNLEKGNLPHTTDSGPLQEAEDRLNDGQIAQAIVILENALLYNPEDLSLYPALFTLYEKTEDLPRLEAFSQKLRTSHQLLPLDAMLTMSQLHERMQIQ